MAHRATNRAITNDRIRVRQSRWLSADERFRIPPAVKSRRTEIATTNIAATKNSVNA